MNLDSRLLVQLRRAWLPLILTVLSGLAGGILIVIQARVLSQVLAGVHLSGWDLSKAEGSLEVFLGVLAGRFILTWLGETSAVKISVRVKEALRQRLLEKIERLGPVSLTGERSGEIAATLVQGLDALDAYFSQFLPQVALAGLVPLCLLLAIFPLDWVSGLVLLLTAPLLPMFMILIGGSAEKMTRRQWGILSRMSANLLETLQGLSTLKALGQMDRAGERIRSVSEQYRQVTMGILRVTFLSSLTLELVSTISIALIAVQIGLRLITGGMAYEQALFILVAAPDFYLPIRQLGQRFHAATSGVSAARRIFEILDTPEAAPSTSTLPGKRFRWQAAPFIQFQNVTTRYPGADENTLHEINLELKAGTVTALIGPSGAGKSTLVNLLLGFMAPAAGRILVDGFDLLEYDRADWRKGIAWVSQTPYFFQGSLAENLTLGGLECSDRHIRQALERVGLGKWLASLPQGLQTQIGDAGMKLSSGQRQRLAMSRAFLRNPGLVILDEPTAHLDVRGENDLLDSIQELCKDRTVLLIAHRLPSLRLAQQVIIMQGGRIVESGSAEGLLEKSPILHSMVQGYRGTLQ